MTPENLIKRQKFVKGKELPNRAVTAGLHGTALRDQNYVTMDTDVNEEYDTFFEFEEDLSEIQPSNMQAEFADEQIPDPIAMEPEQEVVAASSGVGFIIMDLEEDIGTPKYMSVRGFKFSQCSYMKKDGERCKRQAPKGKDICSIHKRMINRKNNNL